VVSDLSPAEEPAGDIGRVLEGTAEHARFLLAEGSADRLVTVEPLLRALVPTVSVVLGSGDADDLDLDLGLELAVVQARRAWIERPRVLNAGPWPSLRAPG
jgi:hypothetical protein